MIKSPVECANEFLFEEFGGSNFYVKKIILEKWNKPKKREMVLYSYKWKLMVTQTEAGASQVVLVVKNLPTNVEDIRDVG